MKNQETAEILAKSKVKLTAVILFAVMLFGLMIEYMRYGKPLAEAIIIYRGYKPEAKAENVIAEVVSEPVVAKADLEGISAAEFMDYLQEINERVMAMDKPESALEKIVLPVEAIMEPVEAGVVEELVIYDGDEPVVEEKLDVVADDVEEAVADEMAIEGEEEIVAEEAKSEPAIEDVAMDVEESVIEEDVVVEDVVNTEKNQEEVIETEVDAPAIDMMKDILAREQGALSEK